MLIDFTPDRKKKFKKTNNYPSLVIDNDVIEYSYIKLNTVVSIYTHINDVTYYRYDENSKLLELLSRFSVSCRNIRTGNETLKDFRNTPQVLRFKYVFNDLDKFLNLVKAEKNDIVFSEMGILTL